MPKGNTYRVLGRGHVALPDTASHTPLSDDREFVSVRETMRISGLGRSKLYELMARGMLEYIKVGKRRLVVRRSISSLGR